MSTMCGKLNNFKTQYEIIDDPVEQIIILKFSKNISKLTFMSGYIQFTIRTRTLGNFGQFNYLPLKILA